MYALHHKIDLRASNDIHSTHTLMEASVHRPWLGAYFVKSPSTKYVRVGGALDRLISDDAEKKLPVLLGNMLWFRTMRINSLDRDFETLFIAPIRFRCEFDDSMQRNLGIWQVFLREIVEIRIKATEDGLVTDNQYIFLSF